MLEPKGPPGTPKCPSWLDKDAKAAWRQIVPMLEQMGVLTRIDVNALARYCRLWSRWRRAEKFIEEKGEVYTLRDEKGNVRCVQQFPQVGIANKLAQQLTRLEQEFGMTPSARTRIQITPVAQPSSKKNWYLTGDGVLTRRRDVENKTAG
jgi:P27 family predicted phage terminase small subunit